MDYGSVPYQYISGTVPYRKIKYHYRIKKYKKIFIFSLISK